MLLESEIIIYFTQQKVRVLLDIKRANAALLLVSFELNI